MNGVYQNGPSLMHTGPATWPGVTNRVPDANQIYLALFGPPPGGFIPFASTNFRFVNTDGKTALENGAALITALSQAYSLTPNQSALSITNRATVYLLDGVYDMDSAFLPIVQYVDIKGIGDPGAIVITSSNATGTIHVANFNDYTLTNVSVENSGGGGSIVHSAAGISDTGVWDNVILSAPNTEGVNFIGTYNRVVGLSDHILNGNISGTLTNSTGQNDSFGSRVNGNVTINGMIKNCVAFDRCFGFSQNGNVSITTTIDGCTGSTQCFGYSENDVTISGTIKNCQSGTDSFGYSVNSNVTVSGNIYNCTLIANGFLFSTNGTTNFTGKMYNCTSRDGAAFLSGNGSPTHTMAGNIYNCSSFGSGAFVYGASGTISGIIKNCISKDFSFGAGDQSTITGTIEDCIGEDSCFGSTINNTCIISGNIINCTALTNSFGYSTASTIDISGSIVNCIGTNNCFGDTSSTGKIISCSRTSDYGTHSGTIDKCTFTDLLSAQALLLDTGATVRYSTVVSSAGDSINGTGAATAVNIYLCSLNTVPNAVNISNNIVTPNNVVDTNVT